MAKSEKLDRVCALAQVIEHHLDISISREDCTERTQKHLGQSKLAINSLLKICKSK